MTCIQYIISLRAIAMVVYKIPYRRARAQPLGRVRRASKGILHTIAMEATFIQPLGEECVRERDILYKTLVCKIHLLARLQP